MKTQLLAVGLAVLFSGSAQAQCRRPFPVASVSRQHSHGYSHHRHSCTTGGGYVYSGPGATPMGSYLYGYGNYLYGLGYAYAGLGQYNYYSSLAATNFEQARGLALNNDLRATEVTFAKREANIAFQAKMAGPRVTREQLVARSEAAAPKRLTLNQYDAALGKLSWPAALQGDEFAEGRSSLEELFADRSSLSSDQWQGRAAAARSIAGEMREQLAANVKDIAPMDFVAAKKFLDSLSHETRLEGNAGRLVATR